MLASFNNPLSLVISFFTFKKEKVGGPPDWECERDAGAETPEKKVATAHVLTPTGRLWRTPWASG